MRLRHALSVASSSTLFLSIQARLESGDLDHRICSPAIKELQYPVCEVSTFSTDSVQNANRCGGCAWYKIHDGDTCGQLAINYVLDLSSILSLNPSINDDCTNLQPGSSICLFARDDAALYTPPFAVLQGTSPRQPSPQQLNVNEGCTLHQLPLAPDTLSTCTLYLDASIDRTGGINATEYPDLIEEYNPNAALRMAQLYNVHITDLLAWNPSLTHENAEFQPRYSYCMQLDRPLDRKPYDDGGNPCLTYNPDEVVEGTDENCVCYTKVQGWNRDAYDESVDWCEIIADDFLLSVPRLKEMNSWLGADCTKDLYEGLEENDERAVCVGTDASRPLHTALNKASSSSVPE